MSYSRWSNSEFYTYWSISNSSKEDKDTQVFHICGEELNFTYKQIKDDIDACCKGNSELKGYMQDFIKEVDHSWPEMMKELAENY